MTDAAPGCFGAASVFALDCKTCNACPHYTACRMQSHKTLEAIRGSINVQDIIARHQRARAHAGLPLEQPAKPAPTRSPAVVVERKTPLVQDKGDISAQDQATIETMSNSKTRAVAVSIAKDNKLEYVRNCLRNGVNPFTDPKKHGFMRVACDMLLTGGFTKVELARQMVHEFGWSEATATSQRAQAISMLQGLGVIAENNGTFILRLQ